MTNQAPTIGHYLKIMRTNHGYSLRHLADLTGLAPSSIKRIEDGTYPTPSPQALLALAGALDIPAGVLVGFIDSYQQLINTSLPNLTEYLRTKYHMKRHHITQLVHLAQQLGYHTK